MIKPYWKREGNKRVWYIAERQRQEGIEADLRGLALLREMLGIEPKTRPDVSGTRVPGPLG